MAGEPKAAAGFSYKPYATNARIAQAEPTFKQLNFPDGSGASFSSPSRMSYNSSGEQNVLGGFSLRYQQDGERHTYQVGVGYQGEVSIKKLDPATGKYEPTKVDTDLIRTILNVSEHPDFKAAAKDPTTGKDASTAALRRGLIKQYPEQFPPERTNDTRIMRGAAPVSTTAPVPS